MGNDGMVISVGAMPQTPMSIEHEIRLVKASLFLGDRVKLYSPTASMFYAFRKVRNWEGEEMLSVIYRLLPYLAPEQQAIWDESKEGMSKLLRKSSSILKLKSFSRKSRALLRAKEEFGALAKDNVETLMDRMEVMGAGIDVGELDVAVSSGMLDIVQMFGADSGKEVMDLFVNVVGLGAKEGSDSNLEVEELDGMRYVSTSLRHWLLVFRELRVGLEVRSGRRAWPKV